jgi:hypothetical protein
MLHLGLRDLCGILPGSNMQEPDSRVHVTVGKAASMPT